MKKIFCILIAFLLVVSGTLVFDILKEDKEYYTESPYRQFYADPANEGRTLTYDDLFFVSSLNEPVYTVGSSGISKEQMAAIQARDAEAEDDGAVYLWREDAPFNASTTIVNEADLETQTSEEDLTTEAGANVAKTQEQLRIYSQEEMIAFQKLLQKLTFRPVEGLKNILLSRLSGYRNSIAVFQLSNRYYSGNLEPYQDILGMVPAYAASIVGQKDRVESGLIFSWRGHVYLDAYLVSRSEYNEMRKMEVPAVWDEYQAVFEILSSDALDELLSNRNLYASGIDESETGMRPLLRKTLILEARTFAVILLLTTLYEIGRKLKRKKQSKRKV